MKKLEYKKYMMKGVDYCFEKLSEALSPSSYYYNSIIHLKGRFYRIKDETNKNLISFSEKNLELDKIQIALLEYIDKLEDNDFVENDIKIKANTQKTENLFNHFWKPFFQTRTTIVIGTYYTERFRAWEASTLMGTGDALALGKIMGTLNNIGIKNIDVVPTYNFTGDRYQDNLILIGGPDANKLTRETYDKLNTKLRFGNPDRNEIALFDTSKGETYVPKYNSNSQVVGDYGFAFKTQNPYNQETNAIILAGCFGFGTCAAAQIFESEKLLEKIEGFENEHGFEVLVYSDIINDWTQKPKIISSYKLPPSV